MQSPQKLHQRLSDLLGPPGPDADPMELALRSIVRVVAPTMEAMLGQYVPAELDRGLEHVALFFLKARSDGQPLTPEFLAALGEHIAKTEPVDGTASVEAEQLEPPPAPAEEAPAELPAAAALEDVPPAPWG